MDIVKRFFYYTGILFSIILLKCTPSTQQADLILFNGKIVTVDTDFSIAQAIAIKDGKLKAVGSNEKISKEYPSSVKSIDLKDHMVIPGIIEGHLHPIPASQSELFYEIPDLKSIDELLTWIYNEADARQDGEWIIHPKFFATRMLEMRQPTLAELDSVAPDNPVFLNGSYAGMINTTAMKSSDLQMNLGRQDVLKDKNTSKPNGLLLSSAFNLLRIENKNDLDENLKLEALKKMVYLAELLLNLLLSVN